MWGGVCLSGWIDEQGGVQGWLLLSVDSLQREPGVSGGHLLSGGVYERDDVRGRVLLSQQHDGRSHSMSSGMVLRADEYRAGGLSERELLSGWSDGAFAVQSRQLLPGGRSEAGGVPVPTLLSQRVCKSSLWPGIGLPGRLDQ